MININEPLELDGGTPVSYIRDNGVKIEVKYPDGRNIWHVIANGGFCGDGTMPKLRNVAKPTEAAKKSDDQEFWERAFIASLSSGENVSKAGADADKAIEYYQERWPR